MVSSLTAGGNGKTPVVVWLVEQLRQRGVHVGVVSWGYSGKAEPYPLLLSADTTTAQAGDEPVLVHQRISVPITVSPARSDAVETILAQHPDVQIIVAGDSLQHYHLARDAEIVVIDGVRHFGNGWWLPVGSVCERAGYLKSINAVIVNDGVPCSGETPMHLLSGQAVDLCTGTCCDVVQLEYVVAIAGIERPPRFFATLKMCGIQPKKCVSLADHQSLNHAGVNALISTGQMLIMTEKDVVKCRAFVGEG